MVRILAIDTCNSFCSVALLENGSIIENACSDESSRQAELLFSLILKILDHQHLKYFDLDMLALTIGPGSFTGIRVGLAAMRGIKLASALPVISITCFEAIALNFETITNTNISVVLDARRNQIYIQNFIRKDLHIIPNTQPTLVNYSDVIELIAQDGIIAGSGIGLLEMLIDKDKSYILNKKFNVITADMVAKAAWYKYLNNEINQELVPLYIRPSDAKLPKS
ncbi:MAG: tRNA (adenosine(37)-N6)-threonylcarbamoyltransferase complex dimerization subunit type 1 TsaB [Rickettsiales endosymbiont of Dermacentor nuttalli]